MREKQKFCFSLILFYIFVIKENFMNTNFNCGPKHPQEESCLKMIKNFRKQVQEYQNQCLQDTVYLEGGNEEKAKKKYFKMLNFLDVSTMLDILADEEREEAYNKIHRFFSGLEIEIFDFPEIQGHYFNELGYSVLDLVLVYKVNVQERLNENLRIYREFKTLNEERFLK